MKSFVALSFALSIAGSIAVSASDWPRFLGPQANGISPATDINKDWNEHPPRELWRTEMSDNGYAGPSAARGRVFIIDRRGDNDVVRALDLNNGETVWEFIYPEPGRHNYGFARSTPTIEGEHVYTLSRAGVLHCLKFDDGSEVWSRDIIADFQGRRPQWLMSMSPIVDGDRLIVIPGGAGAAVAALNRFTGETIWQGGGSDIPGYATPVVAEFGGKKQYVIFTGVSIIGVDPSDGRQLWRHEWRTSHDVNAATPIPIGDHVFLTSGYRRGGSVIRVVGQTGEDIPQVLWENQEIQSRFSTPILYGQHIYSTTGPRGNLVCLDPRTGETLWREGRFEEGALIIVDGVIIVMDGRGGEVAMVEATPERYNELGRFKGLGGQSWVAPIIADGKLIIRNRQTLAAYELKR